MFNLYVPCFEYFLYELPKHVKIFLIYLQNTEYSVSAKNNFKREYEKFYMKRDKEKFKLIFTTV